MAGRCCLALCAPVQLRQARPGFSSRISLISVTVDHSSVDLASLVG